MPQQLFASHAVDQIFPVCHGKANAAVDLGIADHSLGIFAALHCFQVCSRFPINVKTGYGLVSKRYRQVPHEAEGRPSVERVA